MLRVPSGAIQTLSRRFDLLFGDLEALQRSLAIRAIDRDEAGVFDRGAEDGDIEELGLRDHAEVRAEHVEEDRDVVERLMVAHDEEALAAVAEVLAPDDLQIVGARCRRSRAAQPRRAGRRTPSMVTRPMKASTTVGQLMKRLEDVLEGESRGSSGAIRGRAERRVRSSGVVTSPRRLP